MNSRKRHDWKLKNYTFRLGERTVLAGVLSLAPESYPESEHAMEPDMALARAIEIEEAGADFITVGAEPMKSGVKRVLEAEELRRLIPVLKKLRGRIQIPIAVDTYKAPVAAKALETGASIIGDPSGLTWDPQLAKTVARFDAGLILCHMRGTPESWSKMAPLKDAVEIIGRDLDASAHRAVHDRVDPSRIAIDPGLGFGKRKEANVDILTQLGTYAQMKWPLMIGPSRKGLLAQTADGQDEIVDAAAATAAILAGAHMLRVHDVRRMRCVADLADALLLSASQTRWQVEQ